MKKIIGVAAFSALGMIALSSCKKDYTCECVYSGSTVVIETIQLKKMTEKDAKSKCDSYDEVVVIGSGSVVKDCSI